VAGAYHEDCESSALVSASLTCTSATIFDRQENKKCHHSICRVSAMKRTRKAWNGGSVEAALSAARQRNEIAISQGAMRCGDCGGEGALNDVTICPLCRGAGILAPPGGVQLNIRH